MQRLRGGLTFGSKLGGRAESQKNGSRQKRPEVAGGTGARFSNWGLATSIAASDRAFTTNMLSIDPGGAWKVGEGKIRVPDVRTGQVGALENGAKHLCLAQIGVREICPAQVRLREVCLKELSAAQAGPAQGGIDELDSVALDRAEVGLTEIRTQKAAIAQASAGQIDADQVHAVEVAALPIGISTRWIGAGRKRRRGNEGQQRKQHEKRN